MIDTKSQTNDNIDSRYKMVEGIKYKKCKDHYKLFPEENQWFPATDVYFYKTHYNTDGLFGECKQCTLKKTKAREQDPKYRDKVLANKYKQNRSENHKERKRKVQERRKNDGYWMSYYYSNPEKFKKYRQQHKSHIVTKEEWDSCLKYFNYSCAYCGLSEDEVKKGQGQCLHKEHAINYGDDDITNCIPACRSCNSKKWTCDYTEWYNESNPLYLECRYNKIVKWLEEDCFKL